MPSAKLATKPLHIKKVYQDRTLHYINYLGLPVHADVRHLRDDTPLAIIEFRLRPTHPFLTFVTNGMSELWQSTPTRTTLFTELVFYSEQREAWLVGFMEKLAYYPFEHQTFFAHGQTLPMLGPIVPGSPLTSIVVLDPLLEAQGFSVVQTVTGKHIELLWACPISETERDFIKQHGAPAFCKLFDPRQPALITDFFRSPLV